MASRSAELIRPVVALFGSRLAQAQDPAAVRRLYAVITGTMAPEPRTPSRTVQRAGLPTLQVAPARTGRADRVVLWFHGGGFVFGTLRGYDGFAGRLARAAGARVDVPDYRLAPEHPHPAALGDGLRAYEDLLGRVDPTRLVVGGDSAGGNMAVAVLQAARQDGLAMPAGLLLVSPWLDLRRDLDALLAVDCDEILVRPPLINRATGWYAGDLDRSDPRISPVLGDLTGLPPTWITWSASELLAEDSRMFVAAAEQAGVDVTPQLLPDLWHDWPLLAPVVAEARESIEQMGRFVRTVTGA